MLGAYQAAGLMPKVSGISDDLVLTLRTTSTNQTLTIPTQNVGTFNCTIDWGDGSPVANVTSWDDADLTHTYAVAGDYTVTISGAFANFYTLYVTDDYRTSLIAIEDTTHILENCNFGWGFCTALTTFGHIDTSSVTNFSSAWRDCSGLTEFPLLDTSSGTDFVLAWSDCVGLTSFPEIDVSNSTVFTAAWADCASLTDFPAGMFDSWTATPAENCFSSAWLGCISLTAQSVENILVSIAASGQFAPTGKEIDIDYDTGTGSLTTATNAAIVSLVARNWRIFINGDRIRP